MADSQRNFVTERQRLFLWVVVGICLFLGVAVTSCLVTYAVLDTGASLQLRIQVQELRGAVAELTGRLDNASLDTGVPASELTSTDAALLASLKKTSNAVEKLSARAEDNAKAVQQLSAKVDNHARTVSQVSTEIQRLHDQVDVNTKARTDFQPQIALLRDDVAKVSADLDDHEKSALYLSLPSCRSYKMLGLPSGVYSIDPQDGQPAFPAFCDMDTAGGPWLVFQRRMDGSDNFTRNWADYESGFGDLKKEFWLGLEKLHRLTSAGLTQLRVDMATWEGRTGYALYSTFQVANSSDHFRLKVHGYSGNAGDDMYYGNNENSTANGMQFSTFDQGNGRSPAGYKDCAVTYKAGWWYNRCHIAHPNGVYGSQGSEGAQYIVWWSFYDKAWKSLKFMEMKIK